jgi:large subunit ribosomal protein L21e
MGHASGYRSGTRYAFSRPFGQHGNNIAQKQYLRPYKVGDYVDIVVNGTFHKGMPYKLYHGRTGVVFNVSRRALGVEINKEVRNRIEKKRVNVRIEHVRPSKCRMDFLARVKRVEDIKREAKKNKTRVPIELIKRFPVGPKAGYLVAAQTASGLPSVIGPAAFDDML